MIYIQHEVTERLVGSEKKLETIITRGGKGCTLINLSYFESDSTYRRFNELFKLMTFPSLDHIFRSSITHQLKTKIAFIVDNGPGEAPSSPLVRMLLARLLKYIDLDVAAQLSFAEYHSKMNFVERVHATENDCLSRHGPFDSKSIHSTFEVGDVRHFENMEAMANEVINCIQQGKYSGEQISCYRGSRDEDYIFDDEEKLRRFLLLSEDEKQLCDWTYNPKDTKLHRDMVMTWKANSSERR